MRAEPQPADPGSRDGTNRWHAAAGRRARQSLRRARQFGAALAVAVLRGLDRAASAGVAQPRVVGLALLVAAPAALGLVVTLHALGALHANPAGVPAGSATSRLVAAAVALGGLTALYAAGLGIMWLRATQVLRKQHGDLARLDTNLRRQAEDLRDAREHNELLTAMREVSRLVASCDEVDEVLGGVLRILNDFAHPDAAAIFVDDGSGTLALRAHLEASWEADPDVPREVAAVAQQRQVVRRVDRILRQHTLLVPFEADQDAAGVLWVRRGLDPIVLDRFGDTDAAKLQQQHGIDRFDRQIVYFIKHVALAVRHMTLYDRATVDGLTRLFNRQHYSRQLRLSLAMAQRQRSPLSVIMIDIDHFKPVNDTHGHLSGDMVLQGVAELIRATIRESDLAFRYGGEEMAVLCPGTTSAEAAITAERLRVAVEQAMLRGEHGVRIPVTISLGIAEYDRGETQESFLSRADQALYASKHAGRNRYTIAAPSDDSADRAAESGRPPAARSA